MCGIAGILNLTGEPVDPCLPRRMIERLRHRGPDGVGYYADAGVGLGHARLSILDLAGGHQPMSNEDQSLWITFNGEIFNYVELREELVRRGHQFATRSDTEVILHAYEEYGEACVHHFNGQWAFAIWDTRARTLFLSRDRLGVRPVFYRASREQFARRYACAQQHGSLPRLERNGGNLRPIDAFVGSGEGDCDGLTLRRVHQHHASPLREKVHFLIRWFAL